MAAAARLQRGMGLKRDGREGVSFQRGIINAMMRTVARTGCWRMWERWWAMGLRDPDEGRGVYCPRVKVRRSGNE
jgi:hypothetical protein